jgi:glycine/D-amino acid oxidase-like deaminating enzyme
MLHALDLSPLGTGPWTAPREIASVEPPAHADAVIVGAGVSGLVTALTLAERGLSVVVLDRQFGLGATSRSGGIVLGDTVEGPAPGFDHCERTFGEWIGRRAIACDFRWTSCLELTRDERLASEPIAWTDHGAVRVSSTVAAAVIEPVKLLNSLAGVLERTGAIIACGFTVERLLADGTATRIIGREGDIRAPHLVMAVDAVSWQSSGDHWPQRTLTVALQTTVAAAEVRAALGLAPLQPFYTNESPLLWGRPLADGSFMFGRELVPFPWHGSADETTALVTAAGERLAARVRGLHPSLADIGVKRVWAGPTARTSAGIPLLVEDRELPHVVWIGGYGGHGLAQAFTLAQRAAERVLASR